MRRVFISMPNVLGGKMEGSCRGLCSARRYGYMTAMRDAGSKAYSSLSFLSCEMV